MVSKDISLQGKNDCLRNCDCVVLLLALGCHSLNAMTKQGIMHCDIFVYMLTLNKESRNPWRMRPHQDGDKVERLLA